MRLLYYFLLGLLLGISFLPFDYNIVFYIIFCIIITSRKNLERSYGWSDLGGAFILFIVLYSIQYHWIFTIIQSPSHLSAFITIFLLIYVTSTISVLIYAGGFLFSRNIKDKYSSRIFIIPFCYYLLHILLENLFIPQGAWITHFIFEPLYIFLPFLGSHLLDAFIFLLILLLCAYFRIYNNYFFILSLLLPLLYIASFFLLNNWENNSQNLEKKISLTIIPHTFYPNLHTGWKSFLDTLLNKRTLGNIIVFPESAFYGFLQKRNIDIIRNKIRTNQNVLIGTNRIENSNNKNFNSVFFISKNNKQLQVYDKKYLIPFAEYLPAWAQFLNISYIIKPHYPYSSGKIVPFEWEGINIAVGLCYEALFDRWYIMQEKKSPLFYIFLAREELFTSLGKKYLFNISRLKAYQTARAVIRSSQGGYSTVWQKQSLYNEQKAEDIFTKNLSLSFEMSFFLQYGYFLNPMITSLLILCGLKFYNKKIGKRKN